MLTAMRTASFRSSVYVVHGAHNLLTIDCLDDRNNNNDYQELIAALQPNNRINDLAKYYLVNNNPE